MARPRSEQTLLVKEKMIARLQGGFHPPGQRFFSNRGLAAQFGISYQTADRLIRELVDEGWLERRPSAGTYVSGKSVDWQGVALVFHERAKREGSFGARLSADLAQALAQAGIATKRIWSRGQDLAVPANRWLPVLWECPQVLTQLVGMRRFLVVLNDNPPPGLASGFVDSVACDDYSGGACAAELLLPLAAQRRLAVLAGPKNDRRSQQRVAGFQSLSPKSEVFWAESWFAEPSSPAIRRVAAGNFAGVFCCNDRLVESLMGSGCFCAVVGFDDAPVAERLNLTTIAIPWAEMVATALDIVRRRIAGDTGAAAKHIIAPRPVMRTSLVPRVKPHLPGGK